MLSERYRDELKREDERQIKDEQKIQELEEKLENNKIVAERNFEILIEMRNKLAEIKGIQKSWAFQQLYGNVVPDELMDRRIIYPTHYYLGARLPNYAT